MNTLTPTRRIGCIGASYGGFMTQDLQTQTNLFAAAISHAGISDHTSYCGEGYWGYSYVEVSMAGSYPWTRKDLYVDQGRSSTQKRSIRRSSSSMAMPTTMCL